jgi:hypothetical protein
MKERGLMGSKAKAWRAHTPRQHGDLIYNPSCTFQLAPKAHKQTGKSGDNYGRLHVARWPVLLWWSYERRVTHRAINTWVTSCIVVWHCTSLVTSMGGCYVIFMTKWRSRYLDTVCRLAEVGSSVRVSISLSCSSLRSCPHIWLVLP